MPNESNKPPVQEEEILSFLEKEDEKYRKNSNQSAAPIEPRKEEPSFTGLGQAISTQFQSTVAGANDNYWKNIPLENLPSAGMFYADGSELTIRAATVAEIRHWSTIDESDVLDIDDQLNFIIEKCVRFKVNGGQSWLSWRDIAEIDRLYIVFLIHEITFPEGQNELFTKFECTGTCSEDGRFNDDVKVNSSMLQLFEMPQELMQWYSPQYKCFEVVSSKLNETFYLYMPTIGVIERLRKRIAESRYSGQQPDKAFIKMAPYLIQDWSKFNAEQYSSLANNSYGWHVNKFTFFTKFVEQMQEARDNVVSTGCPKCGAKLTTTIFSRDSFTIKDLFLISGRLDQLV
jgi:hypothetical protein